ncbi:MAG: hypothetical protein J1F04_02910 [Oscillospiraceae bacterium]|nr:hypothetical protein [Oscillospiraceae bacterium]
MSSVKSVISICAQNFRKWATDYRMWTIAALLIIMTIIYADNVHKNAAALNSDVSLWIFPFLYSSRYMKLVYTLPVVLMFCDAPFVDKNQTFVMMRTTRMKWLCGQILYIIAASAVYYLFIFLLSVLSTVFIADFSSDWGRTFYTLANGGVVMPAEVPRIEISLIVVEYFTPPQACFFTFLLSWFAGIFLGMVIFFLNLVTQNRYIGIVSSFAFVVWAFAVKETFGMGRFRKFSPISWNTLDRVDVGGLTTNPSFTYCVSVLSALIIFLIVGVFVFGRKKNFDFKE